MDIPPTPKIGGFAEAGVKPVSSPRKGLAEIGRVWVRNCKIERVSRIGYDGRDFDLEDRVRTRRER
jgi:hypothetical protein